MRRIVGILLGSGLAALGLGCTHRAPVGVNDAFVPGDAGSHDANMVLPDVSMPVDAASAPDASGARDAASVTDAPDAVVNACATPIDVSAGGTFMLDTCAGSDHFTSACGAAGAQDLILSATEMGSGTTIQIVGDTGWVLQQLTPTCSTGIGGTTTCTTAGTWASSGADGRPRFYWGIERADGTCAMVQILVTRTP